MITTDQKLFFDTFGFLVLRGLLSGNEISKVTMESEDIMEEARGGLPFDETKWQAIQPFFERRPFLSSLIGDGRINSIVEGLIGPDFFLIGTEGNMHVGDTPWHGGGDGYEILPSIKIAFYTEHLTGDTGALRLIPGSHKGDFAHRLNPIRNRIDNPKQRVFGVMQKEIPAYVAETFPGDILVFTEDVFHSSFGGRPGRHQHAMSFQQVPRTREQIELVTQAYKKMNFSYHPVRSSVNHSNPRLRKMTRPLVDLGFDFLEL